MDRYGHWFTVDRARMTKAERRCQQNKELAVFAGRMLPTVRTLIPVPAGFSRMKPLRFGALSTAGIVIWVSVLTAIGCALGSQYDKVADWVDPITNILFAAVFALYVIRLFRGKGRRKSAT